MFNRTPDESKLNTEIDRVLTDMATYDPPSGEKYTELLAELERLVALTDKNHIRKPVSLDSLVTVGGSLLGILIIVMYESRHVMTSKALPYALKTK